MVVFWLIWEVLQNFLGLAMYVYFGKKKTSKTVHRGKTIHWITDKSFSGISLGGFIFINELSKTDKFVKDHEYGHGVQSKILGPLYLFAVGIPSLITNLRTSMLRARLKKQGASAYVAYLKGREFYYKQYPENWADYIGGVKRNKEQ